MNDNILKCLLGVILLLFVVLHTSFVDNSKSRFRRLSSYLPKEEYTDYSELVRGIVSTSSKGSIALLMSRLKFRNPALVDANNEIELLKAIELMHKDSGGWDYEHQEFRNKNFQSEFNGVVNGKILKSGAERFEFTGFEDRRIEDVFDIIILTGNMAHNNNWIQFLEGWKPIIEGINLIIIQQGLSIGHVPLEMPSWASYELYTKADVDKTLGEHSWLIDMESDSDSAKAFGYMISDKDFVFVLNRFTTPVKDKNGKIINPLEEHLVNLLTPSTPYYHNRIMQDPFRPGTDFVRSYPYFLREGIPTAISIGHALGQVEYDTITRLAKPQEEEEVKDFAGVHSETIPHSVLFSLSSVNMAINRRIAGPLMFFNNILSRHGLDIGDKNSDVMTGWMAKIVLDHVRAGVKTSSGGALSYHPLLTNPLLEVKRDYIWAAHLETIVRFYSSAALTSQHQDTTTNALEQLVDLMSAQLSALHPAIAQLCKAWKEFITVWNHQHGFHPSLLPVASRSSIGPLALSQHGCAVFTIMHEEPQMLPIWLRYYARHFPNAMFVADHMRNMSSHLPADVLESMKPNISAMLSPDISNVTYWRLYGDQFGFPVHFFVGAAQIYQQRLLRSGYKCVLYTDVDEMIAPDPDKYPLGLGDYVKKFVYNRTETQHVRAMGHNIAHVSESESNSPELEPPIDWSKPLLQQRQHWTVNSKYDKPLLSKVPIRWKPGFHNTFPPPHILHDEDLFLLHLTDIDKDYCVKREEKKYNVMKNAHQWETNAGFNNHINSFPEMLMRGQACRIAKGVFVKSRNVSLDNTGVTVLDRMKPSWASVII